MIIGLKHPFTLSNSKEIKIIVLVKKRLRLKLNGLKHMGHIFNRKEFQHYKEKVNSHLKVSGLALMTWNNPSMIMQINY